MLLGKNEDELAELLTREQGKPLTEARGEIRYAASFTDYYAEEARRIYGETIPSPDTTSRIVVMRQPIGIGAGITPWNFPSAMITRKLAPALAAGCTFVLKPAEATPLSALILAGLLEQAGAPAGVFNVVPGAAEDAAPIGKVICDDPRVRALSFTGSTAVGKILLGQCASTIKKVSLELGGNAPFIVFDDADLDEAVAGCMAAKFRNAGQTCVAANRILVHATIYDAFRDALAARIADLKVGSGLEQDVRIGPLIDDDAVKKVESHLADARDKGASIVVGGARHERGRTFFQPTLVENASSEMQMAQEETFGPVAALTKFDTEEGAIRIANDTPMGLAAYFFARDVGRVWRVSEALEYGMIGANTGMMSTAVAPFGGIKESGLGREGSRHGIDEWTELKYVRMAGL
jgi:succinate-semialdehyde dehydrogenase/glutarate-semialdehyde dehydrogenase